MLQQYLTGEALKTIENLGHLAFAYEAANERLERKYGGKRRQIALHIEELEQFRPILFHLCFHCLAKGHPGKSCPRSRQCGQNGCQESHHRLLHSHEGRHSRGMKPKSSVLDTRGSNELNISESSSEERVTFGMEKNDSKEQTTMTTQDNIQDMSAEFIALRTVPVVLKNGNRSMQVNALLDDASTKTYVNADVAEQLGLQRTTARVTP